MNSTMSPWADRFTCFTCALEATGTPEYREKLHVRHDGAHEGAWYRSSDETFATELPDWRLDTGDTVEITFTDGTFASYRIERDCQSFIYGDDGSVVVTSMFAHHLAENGDNTGEAVELKRDTIASVFHLDGTL